MMLFQDGSKHAWLGQGPDLDLIVTMDDATSAITSIFLCEEEGTAFSFRGLSETIRAHASFSSFYTDRGSHYFVTPKAGAKVKTQLTQVGGALKQLHVEHIPSYSPQARGRMERLWDTLQKRLPPLEDERDDDDGGGQSLVGGGLSDNTTPASPWPPRRKGQPSFPLWASSTTSCASRRSASRRWTTPSATRGGAYPAQPEPPSLRQSTIAVLNSERRHRPVPRTARNRPLPCRRDPERKVEGQEEFVA